MQHAQTTTLILEKEDVVVESAAVSSPRMKPTHREEGKDAESSFVEINLSSEPYLHYYGREPETSFVDLAIQGEAPSQEDENSRGPTAKETRVAKKAGVEGVTFEKGTLGDERILPPTCDYRESESGQKIIGEGENFEEAGQAKHDVGISHSHSHSHGPRSRHEEKPEKESRDERDDVPEGFGLSFVQYGEDLAAETEALPEEILPLLQNQGGISQEGIARNLEAGNVAQKSMEKKGAQLLLPDVPQTIEEYYHTREAREFDDLIPKHFQAQPSAESSTTAPLQLLVPIQPQINPPVHHNPIIEHQPSTTQNMDKI